MGVEVFDEIIDFEIRHIIKILNEFSFIQTFACCSGWTSDNGDNVSDGINRTWIGTPYIYLISFDNFQMINFIEFIMKNMIFDYNAFNRVELLPIFLEKLNSVGLIDDGKQLINVALEYRDEKLFFLFYINDRDRDWTIIEKIWTLFYNLINEYKQQIV